MATEIQTVKRFESAQDALVLQSSDLSLETIAQMVDSRAIDLEPAYQRRDRWTEKQQSELIESFLLNVPVPPVYLAEDDFGVYSVIDGKQRITSITTFLRNNLQLVEITKFSELNGKNFSELPRPLQNALSIRPYVRVVTLLKQTHPELKYEVFTRLNTGGQPLLPQEIRNALYRGPFNDMLFGLSTNSFLHQQLKIRTHKESAYKEMQDIEAVLRFLTLQYEWQTFSGNMRLSMDDFMKNHQKPTSIQLRTLANRFNKTISRCQQIWGDNAFRRYENGRYRNQFLFAMFDAQMVAASELRENQFENALKNKEAILRNFKILNEDQNFDQAIRVSTNTPSRVQYRIIAIKNLLTAAN